MPAAAEPRTELLRERDTHRLVPSKYRGRDSVLTRLGVDDADLAAIFALDQITNDRLLAEDQRSADIGPYELVFGVPYYHVINAAFCHAHPLGARFNGPHRGTWYAAFDLRTSQAEVAFHRGLELKETAWLAEDVASYDEYLADFGGEFHDIRNDRRFAACVESDSYKASQALAQRLLDRGSLGVVYPSVRRAGGTCLACFRPALVNNVRRGGEYALTFKNAEFVSARKMSRSA